MNDQLIEKIAQRWGSDARKHYEAQREPDCRGCEVQEACWLFGCIKGDGGARCALRCDDFYEVIGTLSMPEEVGQAGRALGIERLSQLSEFFPGLVQKGG